MAEKREVTNKDLELIDKAIADHETQQGHLYTLRRILSEIGNLDTAIAQTRVSLQSIEKSRDEANAELEAARDELAKIAKQRQETVNEIGALNREIETKRTELQSISNAREQIKAFLEAA
jgi:predicted  nucleic acid-binding Zn-ribbon protein